MTAGIAFLDRQTRLLIVKDFRTFRRDPAQWFQILIFAGLVILYFTNTRRYYEGEFGQAFPNWISLINLNATALLMCAYTGRFIYPMLSLEGKTFWVLGLLPLRRDRLVWGKFVFSALGAALVAETLVIVTDVLLGMGIVTVLIHVLTVAMLALGLSGLSVGLGAWLPNFREADPSKIAVGFGGTLNLVAGMGFLMAEIGLMAAPWHLYLAYRDQLGGAETIAIVSLGVGISSGIVVGLLVTWIPLRLGVEALRRMEF